MKPTLSWMIQTELKQNRLHFLILFCISILLGAAIQFSIQAENKIMDLTKITDWNADLVVLPKGVTLRDFQEELQTGNTTTFLPEAMFDSTLSMSEGKIKMNAVLAIKEDNIIKIYTKGNSDNLGIEWLNSEHKRSDWKEQNQYKTPEWGTKLMSGFFAAGPDNVMKNLKELIDKRTVGQALYIKQQKKYNEEIRRQLNLALLFFSGILFILILLTFFSMLIWLKLRISNSLAVLNELGFSRFYRQKLAYGLFGLCSVLPISFGFIVAQFFPI